MLLCLLRNLHPQLRLLELEHHHRAVRAARDEAEPIGTPAQVHHALREFILDDQQGLWRVSGPQRQHAVLASARNHEMRMDRGRASWPAKVVGLSTARVRSV